MKRCPECRKDYRDDDLLCCLNEGAAPVQGTSGDAEDVTVSLKSDVGERLDYAVLLRSSLGFAVIAGFLLTVGAASDCRILN